MFQSYSVSAGERMPASSVTQNLSELDTLLADLSSAAQQRQQYQDYYDDSADYSKQNQPAR